MKARLVLGGAFPVAMAIAAVTGLLSFDIALSAISVIFSVALVPGIIENQKNRRGWSQQSTAMTSFGLLSMGTMFIVLGLTFTGLTTVVCGVLWSILLVQSFVFAPNPTEASNTPKV